MCSFLLTSLSINGDHPCNMELSRRGPDHTVTIKIDKLTAIHNLLSITGEFTPQPLIQNGVALLFNGEIYNYKTLGDYSSDGQAIIDGYLQSGKAVFDALEGEYSILIFDTRTNIIIAATDTFGTKPFWFGQNDTGFAFASLASAVTQLGFTNPIELPPNSITTYSCKTLKIISRDIVRKFDLRQGISTLDDWCIAFDASIRARARLDVPDEKIFIGLSTGYDSGAIAAALTKLNREFLAFSIVDKKLIGNYFERTNFIEKCADHYYITDRRKSDPPTIDCEPYPYTIFSAQGDYIEHGVNVENDSGALGLWVICDKAQKLGFRVYLSGSGADEIITDYGFNGKKIFRHSNFGGHFPENLYSIFPWPSFFGSSMKSYLRKEEYIAGHFGLEGRYPFLDSRVVQTYLNLDHKAKNGTYKAPIDYYLTANGFPCERGVKYGF